MFYSENARMTALGSGTDGLICDPSIPVVVDLDGTLVQTDTLIESLIHLLKRSPWSFLRLPWWLIGGPASLKRAVAARSTISVSLLPYRTALLTDLHRQKAAGGRIVLATAAHASIAHAVAAHIDLFDTVIATGPETNLTGEAKLAAIRAAVGPRFVYAGDSRDDLPIWRAAEGAILAGTSAALAATVRRDVPVIRAYPRPQVGPRVWLKAIRVHHWMKNLLLFVPLLTTFSFLDFDLLLSLILAFLSFSLSASATYLLNDLWDLESDRAHPRKRLRPLAGGQIPILWGGGAALGGLVAGFALAQSISPTFTAMLLLYVVTTSAYSWALKRYILADVIALSFLYTFRILTGSVVIHVQTSSWLLAFSMFFFLSLSLVKRCAELSALRHGGGQGAQGRDYRLSDLDVLWPLGVGCGVSAVVVFCLFINAPETQMRYATPDLLWLMAIGLIHWLFRLWIKTSRGEMHDDPLVYVIRDGGSLITTSLMIGILLAAHSLRLPL